MSQVERLASLLSLDREHQMRALRVGLTDLIERNQRGIVLADEVGCGKTYEALGLVALLWRHFAATSTPIQRILVVAEPSLMHKWFDEIEAAPSDKRGFQQYVKADEWSEFRQLLRSVERLRTRSDGQRRGVREGGKLQVPPGMYVARPSLLASERSDGTTPIVRWLRRTDWDVVIVDEAHHYAGLHTQRSRVFFPDRTPESRERGLQARFTLALTATPFQLATRELLNLLRIVRAPEDYLATLGDGLRCYEAALEQLYARRALGPADEGRRRWVERLEYLRTIDASGGKRPGTVGLEALLRQYLIRNVKDASERDYALVEKHGAVYRTKTYDKLDDLRPVVAASPLVPLEGDHAALYLELRDLLADVDRAAGEDSSLKPSFLAADLRQCLSSYEQLSESVQLRKPLPRASLIRRRLQQLHESGSAHPKLRALVELTRDLIAADLERIARGVDRGSAQFFSKILVFNTLLKTADALRSALHSAIAEQVEPFVDEQLSAAGWSSREGARDVVLKALREEREIAREQLRKKFKREHLEVSREFLAPIGLEMAPDSRELVDVMFHRAERHCVQSLFLLRLAVWMRIQNEPPEVDAVQTFLMQRVGHRLRASIERIVDDFLDDTPREGQAFSTANKERARREIARLVRILAAPEYAARYDGDQKDEAREMRRENFNRPYAPLVLLVSRVGEEGIDLQAHTRHVIHYDIEWNPAKMEQREGRVDREGRRTTGAVQVRNLLLKDTYEERVFHTVMQRDAWFQVLIGSKRQELAKLNEDALEPEAAIDLGAVESGRLTREELHQVTIDLRP